jgi:hypothetical protein
MHANTITPGQSFTLAGERGVVTSTKRYDATRTLIEFTRYGMPFTTIQKNDRELV